MQKKEYDNLEMGAGIGNFGKIYYPVCYLIDNDKKGIESLCGDNHHIDMFVDAYHLPNWTNNYFKTVILCNPYNFGFRDMEEGAELFQKKINTLETEGKIIIIGHEKNPYCTPVKVAKTIEFFKKSNSDWELSSTVESIDSEEQYPDFNFFQTDGTKTTPNKKITIHVTQQHNI